MRVAMLTGGGDCPGLNAVMRAVARKGERALRRRAHRLPRRLEGRARGPHRARSASTPCAAPCPVAARSSGRRAPTPTRSRAGPSGCRATLAEHGVDALIAIGGEDTLGVAHQLAEEGVPIVGVPKTIDNDLSAHRAHLRVRHRRADLRRRHRSAAHHRREPRPGDGRRGDGPPRRAHRGVGGHRRRSDDDADPGGALRHRGGVRRHPRTATPRASAWRRSWSSPRARRPRRARWSCMSGEVDAFGHVRLGGIGNVLAEQIEARTGYETRVTTLGHVQRGGTPDGLRPGAGDPLRRGGHRRGARRRLRARWWRCSAGAVVRVPLAEAVGELKLVDPELYDVARVFFR